MTLSSYWISSSSCGGGVTACLWAGAGWVAGWPWPSSRVWTGAGVGPSFQWGEMVHEFAAPECECIAGVQGVHDEPGVAQFTQACGQRAGGHGGDGRQQRSVGVWPATELPDDPECPPASQRVKEIQEGGAAGACWRFVRWRRRRGVRPDHLPHRCAAVGRGRFSRASFCSASAARPDQRVHALIFRAPSCQASSALIFRAHVGRGDRARRIP